MFPKKAITLLVASALVGATLVKIVLPGVLKTKVNQTLSTLDGYEGRVNDLSMHVLATEIEVNNLQISKRHHGFENPFIHVPVLTIDWDWTALRFGEFSVDIEMDNPSMNFIDGDKKADTQMGLEPDWVEKAETLMPFRIGQLSIMDGRLRLLKYQSDRKTVSLSEVNKLQIDARNLSNVRDRSTRLPASLNAAASIANTASLEFHMAFDPLSNPPEIAADASLSEVPLTALNPLLREYANVDAEAGTFALFLEVNSKDGAFTGYAKPLLKGADFFRLSEDGSYLGKTWQAALDAVNAILENDKSERSGAKIPLRGELTAVDAELIPAVFSILRNAFIEALSVGIDESAKVNKVSISTDGAASSR